ncbi:hypothetical protein ACFVZH_22640 [Streptomyces sp. NPDC059534]|uniref:hypothetical protein n=1 Tax=Streptomyces sp. NPDC059534 TaxID=3346859 RepID=UPI00369111AD
MLPTNRRLQRAQDAIVAKNARIRELEEQLDTQHRLRQADSRPNTALLTDMEQQLQRQARTITQLRAGVVDDAQTAELRRQLSLAQRTIRELGSRVEDLQAANSGIPQLREVNA